MKKLQKTKFGKDEDFLDFIEQEAQSEKFRIKKEAFEKGHHPPDDMLYDYVLGWLDSKEQNMVKEHIAFCGQCAGEVLHIRAVEDELESDQIPWTHTAALSKDIKKNTSTIQVIGFNYFNFFINNIKRFMPIYGMGLAASFFLLIFWHTRPAEIDRMINKSYQINFVQQMHWSSDNLTLQWEKPGLSYNFISQHEYSDGSRAFGAGIWTGRQVLTKDNKKSMQDFLLPKWQKSGIDTDKWQETPWAVYFRMGKWSYLIKMICISDKDIPLCFWKEQMEILEKISQKYAKRPGNAREDFKIVNHTFTKVKSSLIKLSEGNDEKKNKKAIAFELGHLITYLGPKHIPEHIPDSGN